MVLRKNAVFAVTRAVIGRLLVNNMSLVTPIIVKNRKLRSMMVRRCNRVRFLFVTSYRRPMRRIGLENKVLNRGVGRRMVFSRTLVVM